LNSCTKRCSEHLGMQRTQTFEFGLERSHFS
jgi:hypothetical protein